MQFNNQQFEQGVKQSVDSLERLKKGLDLSGAAKGFADVNKAANSVNLMSITDGLQTISSKFTELGIIGVATLTNLTNSAVNAGKRMISALTIDPVKQGLNEYETKINAIQTILTNTKSKGTTLDDVNKALAELNEYSDTTIYNFAEMTKNIGTFTAAGVDLTTSVGSIKGIANIAAASGASSEDASRAMYQLSQAIASGTVRLQDWNSVQNANIGGEMFKKALIETGKELGKNVPKIENWRESLESGWLSAEVMTTTLNKFANDKAMTKLAGEVTTFTKLFDTMKESVGSGWAISWENIVGDKAEATAMLTSIKVAFDNLIQPSTDARNEMLAFWNANGGRDALINSFANAFQGLGQILKPISKAFRELFPRMTGEKLVELSKGLETLTAKFKISDKTADQIQTTFKGLFSVLRLGVDAITTVVKGVGMLFGVVIPTGGGVLYLTSAVGSFLTSITKSIKETGIFNTVLESISKTLEKVPSSFSGFDKITEIFSKLGTGIANAFSSITNFISNNLGEFNFEKIFAVLNGGLFAAILLGIKNFVGSLTDVVKTGKGTFKGLKGMLDGVKGSLQAYQDQLRAGTLMKIAIAVGILAAALVALSLIDPKRLGSSLTAMTVTFGELMGAMAIFEKFMIGKGLKALGGVAATTAAMIGLSTAVLILSAAMNNLARLDWKEIAKGLVATAALMLILVKSTKALSTTEEEMIRGATGIVILAAALLVLTKSVEKLSKLEPAELAKGLIGVGALMAGLVAFMKYADTSGMGVRSSMGIVLLAGALYVLSSAVKKMSDIDSKELLKSLYAIGALLAGLVLFMDFTGDAKGMISTAVGLTILGAALLLFTKTISILGKMPIKTLFQGLQAMGIALTIVVLAMNGAEKALPGAAAMVIVSGALVVLATALKILGTMSIKEIGLSLLALAGALAVLGAAAFVLAPLVPVMLGLGVAIALIGAGCLAAGVGITALAAGFTALGISGAAMAGALSAIVVTLIQLIPLALQKLAEGLMSFISVVANNGIQLTKLFTTILTSLIDSIVTITPELIDAGMLLILKFLDAIASNIEKIVTLGMDIVIGLLDGISAKLPDLTQAGFDLIISFVDSLAVAVEDNSERLVESFINLGTALIEGLTKGLIGGVSNAIEAVKGVGKTVLNTFKDVFDIHSPSKETELFGRYLDQGLADGIEKDKEKPKAKAKNMADEVLKTIRDTSASISVQNGKYLVDGIVIGMVSKQPDAIEASKMLANAIKDGLVKEEPRFKEIGDTAGTTFLKGLSDEQIIANAWASGVKVSSSAWQGAKTTAEQMAAAGTAAGQAYIDGLNAAARKAAERADVILATAANGQYKKAFDREASDIRNGMSLSLTELSKLTDAEAKKYWAAGGSKAGTEAVKAMQNAGKNAGAGLASGIASSGSAVQKAAEKITTNLVQNTKKTLQIKSPSRVFYEIGQYTVAGFVEGIKTLASSSIADVINSSIGDAPVIRPVLDLNEIQNGMKGVDKMLNTDNQLAVRIANAKNSRGESSGNVNQSTTPNSGNGSMTFVQNNYSPKALSRLDIYRNTKNQFSTMKGLVTNNG